MDGIRIALHSTGMFTNTVCCLLPAACFAARFRSRPKHGVCCANSAGACFGVHTIMRPVLARLYLPAEHLGRGMGAIATVGILMMALGPAIGGLVWSNVGFTGLMSCVFTLNVFALFLIFVLLQLGPDRGVS